MRHDLNIGETGRATPACDSLPKADLARLDRWRAHLVARGTDAPEERDFLSFGKRSTLERLHRVLRQVAPEQCGPLGRVISDLRKASRNPEGAGGQRGPALVLAIPRGELRADWRLTLEEMGERRARLDRGLLLLSGPTPPAASMIRDVEYVLRVVSKAAIDAGLAPALDEKTVRAWLAREDARERRSSGLSLQLRLMSVFLAYRGEAKKLRKTLAALASQRARRASRQRKRKHQWLRENPTDIAKVWTLAEDLLEESVAMQAGGARRYLKALHAAALALPVNMPLRIGDLSRLRIGEEIVRDATGWSAEIDTAKTGFHYDAPELWPEITPFLDALLTYEAPGGDLWAGYDQRAGAPLFSRDGGRTALTADWISDVWSDHVGIGAHIIRTLWHEVAYHAEDDLTWMALALCGQRGGRTDREYRERRARKDATRAGRARIVDARERARREAAAEDRPRIG